MHHTYAEYLALEEESSTRHEFLDGEIYAVAGGTPDHAALAGAVIGVLQSRLPQGCRVFTSDVRIRIAKTVLSTYPDGAVVCGRSARAEDDPLAVVNPVLLLEVTSPSNEQYERGEKLRHTRPCRAFETCWSFHITNAGSPLSVVSATTGGSRSTIAPARRSRLPASVRPWRSATSTGKNSRTSSRRPPGWPATGGCTRRH